jgi:hypothetical protein
LLEWYGWTFIGVLLPLGPGGPDVRRLETQSDTGCRRASYYEDAACSSAAPRPGWWPQIGKIRSCSRRGSASWPANFRPRRGKPLSDIEVVLEVDIALNLKYFH